MGSRAHSLWLSDIREEIAGILDLTRSATAESFAANWAMMRAVQHALLIIAEASKNVPMELKQLHPEVPWHKIHGLGNLLRHEYRRIEPPIIWSVVSEHLKPLDNAAAMLLELDRRS